MTKDIKKSAESLGAAKVIHKAAALSDAAGSETGFRGAKREDAELLDEAVHLLLERHAREQRLN